VFPWPRQHGKVAQGRGKAKKKGGKVGLLTQREQGSNAS